ncbi:S9 family peptidase [Nonomuraea sediminis]|uniref:S9 family peptidase n=1 Tax=Nonomuraea sediminis TaxID=2835864 RepID=UPI001BDCBA30|nr:prolyl oligopeptidase family serine peptidase [Nonomuraea sediminis]
MTDMSDRYRTAELLLGHNRDRLVRGGKVRPVWDQGRFWYRSEGRFHLVDPAARTRAPAFDHERLAAVLGGLPTSIALADGAVDLDADGKRWRCELGTYALTELPARGPLDVVSPDGRYAAFRKGHDLWLRELETGLEHSLTTDGTQERAYGVNPDSAAMRTLARRLGLPYLPPVVLWSPDSRRLVTHRLDQRGVLPMHLVESAPPGGGRPVLHTYRYPLPGDEVLPRGELVVFDVATRTAVRAKADPILIPYLSPISLGRLWWDEAVHYLEHSRDLRTLRLRRLDPGTGEVRTLVVESGRTRVEATQQFAHRPIVKVIPEGVLWYSQRDGWGHLYLYGERLVRLTAGEWSVTDLLHADASGVYFTAAGLVPHDPYLRQVCRVGLDGTGFTRITDDDLDHAVSVADDGSCFVDSASAAGVPPVVTVRGWDGEVLVELERADIDGLLETGWRPPERVRVKAADGETDLYGLLYLPHGFDPAGSYPVVDHPYPGPQMNRVQPTFDPGTYGYDAEAVAALGFAVLALDGRGTPGRSKDFHDASYGALETAGHLDDHVAALRQLAATRPWLDLERVGIFGRSGGGFATVRAMLDHPDVFKVGVAECGNHDQRLYHALWGESYQGPYDAEAYTRAANPEFADRLRGRLLLVHGELDDNVTPHLTMRLVERLIAADRDFDLLIVPGAEHAFIGFEHYVTRRRWDYLVRHLLGVTPPSGYRLAPVPFDPSSLFG